MLVLSRRKQESIRIGEDITITVLDIDNNGQVRIGIDAPAHYKVLRQELLNEITAENAEARIGPSATSVVDLLRAQLPKDGSSAEEPAS